MNRLGLRHRILLAAVIPALLVAAAITLLQTRDQAAQAHVEQHRRLAAIARQLTAIAAYDLFVGNRDALQKLVDAARSDRDIVGIILLDAQDNIMASTLPAEPLPGAEVPHTGFSLDPGNEILEHWHSQTILGSRDMGTDLFVGQASEVPLGQLLLKISNIHLEEDIRAAVLKSAGLAALMLLFAILLAWLLSRSLIQTLAEIGRVVEGVGQGRHDLQVAAPGNDELGQLAIGINRMVTAVGQTHDMLAVRIAAATTTLRQERDAAEQAGRARSRFFAAASHDLRQPVHALGLFATRLKQDAADTPLQANIQRLAEAVRNLQGLLDTLLDYSRLDGQVFQVEKGPVGAQQLIGPLANDFATAAAEKQIALRIRIADCTLLTDAALIRRILINLIGNAVRYTRQGGVLVACRCRHDHARIEIWDSGPGIRPEYQDTIFEELVQLENPERDPGKGLGLGLAIVRRTAELLDHPLALCSRVGHGTRFSLRVPLAPPVAQEEANQDDEILLRPLLLVGTGIESQKLNTLLVDWQFDCIPVGHLTDVSDWVGCNGTPAFILVDLDSDTTAIEAAQAQLAWLEQACASAPPVLFISATPVPGWKNRENPPRYLLVRPFHPGQLRALISSLLSN